MIGRMGWLLLPMLAIRALRRNAMRTLLTMLGVIIGVAAVICTVAIGDGAAFKINQAIASIGANLIWVEAGGTNLGGVRTGAGGTRTLTVGDLTAIQTQVKSVTNVSPQVDTQVQLIYGNQNWRSTVRGVTPEYLALKNWPIVRGGMFTEQEIGGGSPVCALGDSVAQILFGEEDPLGATIRVKDLPCRVA